VDNVDLDIFAGEVHGLVGENGAGKSTLMRILAGLYSDYEGRIEVSGKETRIMNVRQARRFGVAMVHQELSLVPELTVAENIFLGREPGAIIPGFISRNKAAELAAELLKEIGVELNPRQKIGELSVAFQQLVEIAKGISIQPKVLILDEPTSSLTAPEIKDLFKVIRRLKAMNTAVVYISHKLDEIFEIAERVTVLRDGVKVASDTTDKWDEASLIRAMVGREFSSLFPHDHVPDNQTVVMELKNFSQEGAFQNISFKLHKGEVLGIYGLIGAGRSEVAESIFGLSPATSGEMTIRGQNARIKSPWEAKSLGLALVPEDRRGRGLVLMHSIGKNLSLPVLKLFSSLGFVRQGEESNAVNKIMGELRIQAEASAAAETLSGGNQQKVVIGKWLIRPPSILILDEPTRGIDVSAKAEVHATIDRLASQGMAIILVSSELPEILGMSDRVLVMWEGEIVCEYSKADANAETLGAAAAGVCLPLQSAGGRI
jgi:ABC-type sugar transport system ATPase subunit